MTLDKFITHLGHFFLILNTLLFIVSYTKKDKALKYFIMYLILCLFIQIFSDLLFDLRVNNLFLSHYFFVGQFLFLSLFFSTLYNLKKIKNLNKILTIVITIPFVTYLINFPEALKRFNIFEIAITSIPLIIYSFFFFVKKLEDHECKKYIYFNAGFFLYTLCSTLIFTLGNIGSGELKMYVWHFNTFLYIVFQILVFVEWFKNFRKPALVGLKKN
jgi:hypothetical protein